MGCGRFISVGFVAAALAVAGIVPASALAATTPPTTRPAHKPDAWSILRDKSQAAFNSGDPGQIAGALDQLRSFGKPDDHRQRVIDLLMQAKRYDDAEQMAVDLILAVPHASSFVALAEKFRFQAFIAQHNESAALSAARSYYDLADLKDSSDAINTLVLALALTRPDDPTIAKRFKKQQIAWASADPASQPAGSLGDPILATIPPDSKPYLGAAQKLQPLDFRQFEAKGNLLLLEGKPKEARDLFEQAEALAPDKLEAEAIENVARAIRDQAGCIAPANAYILQQRAQQQ
jgi:predicted negative regulator of RcsB-dependent stress response